MILYRQTTFREIKQVQAYDFDSLVGNVGGYMGLFLGYAILNLPHLLLVLFYPLRKKIESKTRQLANNNKSVNDLSLIHISEPTRPY